MPVRLQGLALLGCWPTPIVSIVSQEHRLVSSTRLIAGLTLVSRLLGLARECTYAYFFGTGELLSAFRVAFMVPNLARRLFGEGALSAAFIPVFASALRDPDPRHARTLAGGVLTLLGAALGGLVLLGEAGVLTAYLLAQSLTLKLTAIMLPYMALICLTAFLGGLLNTLHRFAAPAAAPMILNTVVVLAMVAAYWFGGLGGRDLIYVTCGAVLLAGVMQVGLQVLALRRTTFRPAFNRNWGHPDIRTVAALMGPTILGLSTVQFNTFLDILIAKVFVPDGQGPAVLGYAHILYQLPLGVFGIALATAIFPLLAARAAEGDRVGLRHTVERGLRLSFFIALPASVGLILLRYPIVVTLFQRGSFAAASSDRVTRALVCYAIGLWAYSLQQILVRAFYSLKDSRTPVRISMSMVALNLTLNLILVHPLGEAGVALATAISATLQVIWLGVALSREIPLLYVRTIVPAALKTVVATAGMAVCVWLISGSGPSIGTADWSPLLKVAVGVPAGALVFGGLAALLRTAELRDLLRRRPSDGL